MSRVDEVLSRIKDAGMKLCQDLQTKVPFLRYVVSAEGIKHDPNNVAKVINWPVPHTVKQVKHFFATASYYLAAR